MSEIDKALVALRSSRDALKSELEADVRWQHLRRLENAIATLEGAPANGPASVAMASTSTLSVGRPPASEIQERGTNPLLLTILSEDVHRVWRVEDLVNEMKGRGWETDAANPHNALGTALLRMAKRHEAEKVGRGRYRAAIPQATIPETAGALTEGDDDEAAGGPNAFADFGAPLWSRGPESDERIERETKP